MRSPRPRARRSPLRIVYLIPDAQLFGGVKIVLHQANLLADLGHRVTVASPAPPPAWFSLRATYLQTPDLAPSRLPDADVTVATYWTTIEQALASGRGQVVHYCQGLEFLYSHNVAEHPAIHAAYRHPLPAMVVSSHLQRHLAEHFGRPSRVIPQPLESWWKPRWRRRPAARPRLLVTSPFEIDWKGVPTSLRAVAELRRRGREIELVRLSQWPLSEAERQLLEPDEFHEHLEPRQVPELMRSCDLLLAASSEAEGFGLPVLEAMACGVPVIASDVSSFRSFAVSAARLVPFDQPLVFADAADEILCRPALWRRMRRQGWAVARGYREGDSARAAEAFMYRAVDGEWERSP